MAHTQEELASYTEKAKNLDLVFGEKSLKVVKEITNTLENLLRWDDGESISIELGYWYNVEGELSKGFVIGMDLNSAREKLKDKEHRVVKIDGIGMMITCDFHEGRLNLEVEDNIIVKVYRG